MCSKQPEFDDDRIGAVSQRDDLVVLVGKGDAGVVVVPADRCVTVVNGQGGDDLVARVRERGQLVRSRGLSP